MEFEEAIRKSRTNSSAGMNGVSYNMLKRLPPELVTNLHTCLVHMWEHKAIPEWWTKRWSVPISKTGQEITDLEHIRP